MPTKPQCHIYSSLKAPGTVILLPAWAACANTSPFSGELFSNIQPECSLVQLCAISSCPIASYLGKKAHPHLATTSFQGLSPAIQSVQILL